MINERHRQVYSMIESGATQKDIAREMGISQTRVSQMNARNRRVMDNKKAPSEIQRGLYKFNKLSLSL